MGMHAVALPRRINSRVIGCEGKGEGRWRVPVFVFAGGRQSFCCLYFFLISWFVLPYPLPCFFLYLYLHYVSL